MRPAARARAAATWRRRRCAYRRARRRRDPRARRACAIRRTAERLAARAADHARTRNAGPLFQAGEDPAPLLAHERLDLVPGRIARRADRKARGVHRDADRAPLGAHEAIADHALAQTQQPPGFGNGVLEQVQLRGQSVSCCSSIHCSASALMEAALRPVLSMTGPIRTVTMPGLLTKALRGHKSP